MDNKELLDGAWVKELDGNSLAEVEVLVMREINLRKAKAYLCFHGERKTHLPLVGSLTFIMTWFGMATAFVMFGILGFFFHTPLEGITIIFLVMGVAMLLPARYFTKRYNAFVARFKAHFPRGARILGWK